MYGDLRCGLVHEYYVKERCIIKMREDGRGIGVRWNESGYVFVVERYFEDFKQAFLRLGEVLYPNRAQNEDV